MSQKIVKHGNKCIVFIAFVNERHRLLTVDILPYNNVNAWAKTKQLSECLHYYGKVKLPDANQT